MGENFHFRRAQHLAPNLKKTVILYCLGIRFFYVAFAFLRGTMKNTYGHKFIVRWVMKFLTHGSKLPRFYQLDKYPELKVLCFDIVPLELSKFVPTS